jgi:hypothetical protein
MPDRYFFVDLDFFHKRTCARLLDDLGPYGPLAWLSLVAEAKRSRIPGTVIVTSEPDFWLQLGLAGHDLGFTMNDFLTLTGRLKHTSRTPVGRLTHITLTRYEDWQKDQRRFAERIKKRRTRAQNEGDIDGTGQGTTPGHDTDADGDLELELELVNPPYPPSGGNGTISKKELRRYTGCRITRGTHGSGYARDPLGVDKPPPDWPHDKPTEAEVIAALEKRDAAGVAA